jgi:hypothetical protein
LTVRKSTFTRGLPDSHDRWFCISSCADCSTAVPVDVSGVPLRQSQSLFFRFSPLPVIKYADVSRANEYWPCCQLAALSTSQKVHRHGDSHDVGSCGPSFHLVVSSYVPLEQPASGCSLHVDVRCALMAIAHPPGRQRGPACRHCRDPLWLAGCLQGQAGEMHRA